MGIVDCGGAAKNKSKVLVQKVYDADYIIVMMTYLASADEQRNCQEATAPEKTEKANMVSMGIEHLQHLVQQPLEIYASD